VVGYDVTDAQGATVHQTETITITGTNDVPTAAATNSASTNEDNASTALALLTSDVDNDATLTYSVKSGAAPSKGTVTFDQAAGTFVYTPNANANGSDSFTILVTDNHGATTQQVVSVTIGAVNDAPVNTIAGYSTSEDTAKQLTGLSVADVDAASGTIKVTLSVNSGTISAGAGSGVSVVGSGTATVDLTGTLADINAYLAASGTQPSFAPAADMNGSVTLTMTTTDNGNTGSGGAHT